MAAFNTPGDAINVNDVDEFDVGPVTDTDGPPTRSMRTPLMARPLASRASASDADATNNAITYTLR